MLAMDEEDDKEKGEGQDEDTMRDEEQATGDSEDPSVAEALNVGAADQDEYIWMWKVMLYLQIQNEINNGRFVAGIGDY